MAGVGWDSSSLAGFTTACESWLPAGDARVANVQSQAADPASTLSFVRDLLALRRTTSGLATGELRFLPAPDGMLAWRRDQATVAVNLGAAAATIAANGTIALGTNRARDGEQVRSRLELAPNEGVVILP